VKRNLLLSSVKLLVMASAMISHKLLLTHFLRIAETCLEWSACISHLQVKLNVQRTLAIELQRLSVQFRKQQKAYLNRLRQKSGPSASGASFSVLDETAGTSGREALDPEYDPGFNEIQVSSNNTNTKHPVVLAAW